MEEIWKPVVGYEGLYEVNQFGSIKTINRRRSGLILKQQEKRNGYMYVSLYKNGYKTLTVHNIVASAFPEICGNRFEKAEINHKDENPKNNSAENLEWCTHTYNINYGNRNKKVAEKAKNRIRSKEWIDKMLANRNMPKGKGFYNEKRIVQKTLEGVFIREFPSIAEAAKFFKKDVPHISSVCRGKLKTAYGYKWEYAK